MEKTLSPMANGSLVVLVDEEVPLGAITLLGKITVFQTPKCERRQKWIPVGLGYYYTNAGTNKILNCSGNLRYDTLLQMLIV